MKFSLSILIPAYNVAGTIETVVKNAYTVANKISDPLEIIVIDDGSTDKTNAILRKLAPHIPHLKIINHDTNLGYGATIKELYMTGKNTWLFTIPGDGQYNADQLVKMKVYIEKADMILGWRKFRQDPPSRLFQSWVYNRILNILFRLNLHDVNTIRLMKRDIIKNVDLKSTTAFVDAELAIRARRAGYKILETPVEHKKRVRRGATGGNLLRTILPTIVDIVKFIV